VRQLCVPLFLNLDSHFDKSDIIVSRRCGGALELRLAAQRGMFPPIGLSPTSHDSNCYSITRYCVLLSPNSTERSYNVLPIMVFFTILIDIYFTFTEGAKKSFSAEDDWSDAKALWISVVTAAGCSLFSLIFGIPFLIKKLVQKIANDQSELAKKIEQGDPLDVSPALARLAQPGSVEVISSPSPASEPAATSSPGCTARPRMAPPSYLPQLWSW
jgi:hypothetical protein